MASEFCPFCGAPFGWKHAGDCDYPDYVEEMNRKIAEQHKKNPPNPIKFQIPPIKPQGGEDE